MSNSAAYCSQTLIIIDNAALQGANRVIAIAHVTPDSCVL